MHAYVRVYVQTGAGDSLKHGSEALYLANGMLRLAAEMQLLGAVRGQVLACVNIEMANTGGEIESESVSK